MYSKVKRMKMSEKQWHRISQLVWKEKYGAGPKLTDMKSHWCILCSESVVQKIFAC
jgi:hypothetical protein